MSASGSTNYFREVTGIEETCYGICLQCDKNNHLGQKLLLPELLDGMMYELDIQDPQKKRLLNLPKEVRQSFRVPVS